MMLFSEAISHLDLVEIPLKGRNYTGWRPEPPRLIEHIDDLCGTAGQHVVAGVRVRWFLPTRASPASNGRRLQIGPTMKVDDYRRTKLTTLKL